VAIDDTHSVNYEEAMNSDSNHDIFLFEEHSLTPANLSNFDKCFNGYFSFGCSVMSNCLDTCYVTWQSVRWYDDFSQYERA